MTKQAKKKIDWEKKIVEIVKKPLGNKSGKCPYCKFKCKHMWRPVSSVARHISAMHPDKNDKVGEIESLIRKALSSQLSDLRREIEGKRADDSWGWDYFFHGQDQCCPGDDYANVYNKAISDILNLLDKKTKTEKDFEDYGTSTDWRHGNNTTPDKK